jgi:hypothetical protein
VAPSYPNPTTLSFQFCRPCFLVNYVSIDCKEGRQARQEQNDCSVLTIGQFDNKYNMTPQQQYNDLVTAV